MKWTIIGSNVPKGKTFYGDNFVTGDEMGFVLVLPDTASEAQNPFQLQAIAKREFTKFTSQYKVFGDDGREFQTWIKV